MPLANYGVIIGTLDHFERDSQGSYGKYFHGHIFVNAPGGLYDGAVDVSVPNGYKIHYKVVNNISRSLFNNVMQRPNGFHFLASNPTSGALDYVRSPLLRYKPPWLTWASDPFALSLSAKIAARATSILPNRLFKRTNRWIESTGNNALDAMEAAVTGSKRVFVFGVKFNTGRGVHDVHMNQGDPKGSQWYQANGIWQDGGTIAEKQNGRLVAFLTKFSNQTMNTDDNGNPR